MKKFSFKINALIKAWLFFAALLLPISAISQEPVQRQQPQTKTINKIVTTHTPSSPGLTGESKSKIKQQNTGLLVSTGNDGEQLHKILFNKLDAQNTAKFLGWVSDPALNICGGYYKQPSIVTKYHDPVKDAPIEVTATEPAFFSQYGTSVIRGNVTINQPGRQVTADQVTIYHDKTTGKLHHSILTGHVHLREYGKLVVAQQANWDFQKQIIILHNAIYHLNTPIANGSSDKKVEAFGKANVATRDQEGTLNLCKATYSTCAPTAATWQLYGNNVTLNKKTGRGEISNSLLYVKGIPVFYWPYLNFPLDKRRKSGFLFPNINFDRKTGIDFALPYYFNLAPNYDLTLTPRYAGKRKFAGEALFRYLTPGSNGSLEMEVLPDDNYFANFRDNAKYKYPPGFLLNQLENASSARGAIAFKDTTIFNPNWSSNIAVNYVTDNYFSEDLGNIANIINDDQLLNRMDLQYQSEHWNFLGRVQTFQTLQTLTRNPIPEMQYRMLPQLSLSADYPDQWAGLDYLLVSELTNFDYDYKFDPISNKLIPIGTRFNLQPGIMLPYESTSGYINPKLQLQATIYNLQNNNNVNTGEKLTNDITRALPIFSLDSGLFFQKAASVFNHDYTQTLEPRLYYLYIPYQNQNDIPDFDTSLSVFSFDQLFMENRFSGLDRLGDANQVSLALTSRLLDTYSAEEKFSASIGEIYQFQKHRVSLDNNSYAIDPLMQYTLSPLIGQMQYNLNPFWSAAANLAWDINNARTNNGGANLRYQNGTNKIFYIGYNFVRNGDPIPGDSSRDLNRINLAAAWPITDHWNLVGNWNYNISHNHPATYFYGIEYDSCCFAVRLVQSATYTGTDSLNNKKFDHTFYLQFLLKGLGNIGTNDAGNTLRNQIPGYQDHFSSGFGF